MSIQRLAGKSVLFLGAPHIGTWWILAFKSWNLAPDGGGRVSFMLQLETAPPKNTKA